MEKAHSTQAEAAIDLLQKAVELDPDFAMGEAGLGHAYVLWGKYPEKARQHLERALNLAQHLTDKDRLFVKASLAVVSSDFGEAARTLRQIVAGYPLEVEAYWRLGHVLEGEEQLEAAAGVLREGLVVDSESKDLYNGLGNVFSELGRHDEAIAAEKKYLALAVGDPNAHDSLGMAYQWAGQYDLALAEYDRSLALDPQFTVAVFHRASLYFQMGRYGDAIHEMRDVIDRSEGYDRDRALYELGCLYFHKRDLRAADVVTRQMKAFPFSFGVNPMILALARGDMPSAVRWKDTMSQDFQLNNRGAADTKRRLYYGLGVFALRTGHPAEAINNFKDALRRRPPRWVLDPFEDCLAEAYIELGRYDEAIAEYGRVLRLNPNHAISRYNLARAYESKGRAQAARSEYQRFLDLWKNADPDIPELVDARQRISSH
jgi:tetratricopeptide (TPR) repeat protein